MIERPQISVLLVTAPSGEAAERIVAAVVEERLAACGNIIPGVRSIYRWQDAVQHDDEVLIVFKTSAVKRDALAARVQQLHPYDVPEVLAFPVGAGLESYVEWVQASTND